ncbi:AAA domain-containing protein [Gaiella occulta]|uniref:AAA domain-containing protein n=1 Tax=Gaiella occulta TaxID=1002870 RepID=A0A7M2Z1N7_9ACTN|nr:polysaccharide biosynthesis tyrosine autokinase [Gaiella occulta]RDI76267.1 AAA domain-containing protein [Gaiella occulta]
MELRRYLATVWRWKWLILAILAATATVVWANDGLRAPPPSYRATATLLVTTPPGQPTVYPPEAVRTLAVAREAIRAAQVNESPAAALTKLTLAPKPGTSLVDVQVENEDPDAAARLANAFARAYLEGFANALQPTAATLAALTSAHERLAAQALALARSNLDPTRKQWALRWLQTRDDLLAQAYAAASLQGITGGNSGEARLLQAAAPPEQPLETPLRVQARTLGGIGLVALIGALALVFALEYLDVRVRSEADVREATGMDVLATLPSRRRLRRAARRFRATGRRHSKGKLPGGQSTPAVPDARLAEAFQSLRIQIDLASRERPLQTILVTSPWAGQEKAWVAAYLGTVFARAGQRVVLVSADLHRPVLEMLFRVGRSLGLAEAEADAEIDPARLLCPTWVANLAIVPAGRPRSHPADVLASGALARALAEAKAAAEIVIVEAPPALAGTEASLLVPHCDAVLLVLAGGQTTREQARAAKAALEKARNGALFLGSVLSGVADEREARRYTRRLPRRRLLGRA